MVDNYSEEELALLSDQSFLLQKRELSIKIEDSLKKVYQVYKSDDWLNQILENEDVESGKISKGENYNNLPYFVLDYPRVYSDNTFAIRTMILWGRHIGFYFLVDGKHLSKLNSESLFHSDLIDRLYINISDSKWNHEIIDKFYSGVNQIDTKVIEKVISDYSFFKIGLKLDIKELPNLKSWATRFINVLTRLLE